MDAIYIKKGQNTIYVFIAINILTSRVTDVMNAIIAINIPKMSFMLVISINVHRMPLGSVPLIKPRILLTKLQLPIA